MQLGVIFPTLELSNDPVVIRDYAQAVEALGYHHILLLDHAVGFDRQDFVTAVTGRDRQPRACGRAQSRSGRQMGGPGGGLAGTGAHVSQCRYDGSRAGDTPRSH